VLRARNAVLTLALAASLASPASAAKLRVHAAGGAPCEVHVAFLDGSREIRAPCGAPMDVAAGESVGWIERPGLISRATFDASRGGDVMAGDLVRSTMVTIAPAQPLEPGQHAVLLAPRFLRPVLRIAIARPHAVPEGEVLAAVLDRNGDAVAISRPSRGNVLALQRNTDLLAILHYPRDTAIDDVGVHLTFDDGRERRPDVMFPAAGALVAVWYGLTERSARIHLDSKTLRLPVEAVTLARAGVTTVRASLEPLPTLTVAIGALPPSVNIPPLTLSVLTADQSATLTPRTPAAPGKEIAFAHLPAVHALVLLEIGAFKTGAPVDLTDGRDARVDLPLEPVPVAGTVYAGDAPAAAEIRFLQKGEPVVARTDGRGKYSITLWAERRYFVDVLLLDKPDVPPLQDVVRVAANQTLDFHLPAMRFAARIRDAEDGKPVPKARVTLRNAWTAADGPHSSVRAFPSDALAVTELPPQRAGTSEIRVSAPGYAEAGPIAVQIDASVTERIVDVAMKRAGQSIGVDLRLPDGTAAAGAELAASPDGSAVIWRGTAGDDGRVEVPKAFEGMLLVARHTLGASAAWRARAGEFRFGAAAPPLALTVTPRDDSRDAKGIVAWIGGVRLAGAALAFATWSSALTDRDHRWIARNVPPEPLRVLAAPATGAYDAVATVIPYPWPANASIQPVP
jgi:hypothetical protein